MSNLFKTAFRVALVTAVFAMLGFALGGFVGVIGVIIMESAHLAVGVMNALWYSAIPGSVLGALTGFVITIVSEKRVRMARRQSVS